MENNFVYPLRVRKLTYFFHQWTRGLTTVSFWLNTNHTQQLNQTVVEGEGFVLWIQTSVGCKTVNKYLLNSLLIYYFNYTRLVLPLWCCRAISICLSEMWERGLALLPLPDPPTEPLSASADTRQITYPSLTFFTSIGGKDINLQGKLEGQLL